jgi:Rod binding domain-containing protein
MTDSLKQFTDQELIGELLRRIGAADALRQQLRSLGMEVAGPAADKAGKTVNKPAMSAAKKAYWDQARQEADTAGVSVSELLKSRREAVSGKR